MADARITVDVKTNLPEVQKVVAETKKETSGLETVLKVLGNSIEKGFSTSGVVDFCKESITAAAAAGGYTRQVDELATAFESMQVAIGNALLPVLNAIAPAANNAISWLTGIVNTFSQSIGTALETSRKTIVSDAQAIFVGMAESGKTYFESELAPAAAGAVQGITTGLSELFLTAQGVWSDIASLGAPIEAWFNESFTTQLQTWITTCGTILAGLLDTFQLVFSDIWNLVIFPTLQFWTENILPPLTEFVTNCLTVLGTLFDNIKLVFDTFWSEGIAPVLVLIQGIWMEMWTSLVAAWEEYGQPIFTGISELIQNVANTLQNAWETIIKPVWDMFIEVVTQVWNDHLKPLWDNLLGFIGAFAQMALDAYNNFILPIVNWLINNFGPAFVTVFGGILETVGGAVGGVVDFINGIVTTLTEIINFLTIGFSGDWSTAWEGIMGIFEEIFNGMGDIVKGVVNTVIDFINGMISAVVSGINTAIRAINKMSFTAPSWVPGIGGQTFGFQIPTLTAPQIPRLATGAVIPPNREFMAVLGDQRSGTNIETPEGLLRQIFREESGNGAILGELREILSAIREGKVMTVDKRVFGEVARETMASAARAGGLSAVPVR